MGRGVALAMGLLLAALGAHAAELSPELSPDEARRLMGGELGGAGRVGGELGHRQLHFTFDDGPDPRTTPTLLDKLDRHGVKATFFFSASRFRDGQKRHAGDAELAREVRRRGHMVGSHSVDHQRMGRLAPAALEAQLALNDALFLKVFGERTFLFRPPFGSSNSALDGMLQARGYTTVMWNLGIADWVERPASALGLTFRKVLERAETEPSGRGGIVLLHDTHAWTVEAFDGIMQYLEERNCALLATDEELFDVVDDIGPFIGSGMSESERGERQRKLRERHRARCGRLQSRAI